MLIAAQQRFAVKKLDLPAQLSFGRSLFDLTFTRPSLFSKHFGSLRERQIVRHLLEIAAGIVLLYANGFEEKSLTFHPHLQERQFPIAGRSLCLLNLKRSSLIQMA